MNNSEWYLGLGALQRLCRSHDDTLGEGEDVVFLTVAAVMCREDGVGDVALVSDETLLRYIRVAGWITKGNVRGWVECWRTQAAA